MGFSGVLYLITPWQRLFYPSSLRTDSTAASFVDDAWLSVRRREVSLGEVPPLLFTAPTTMSHRGVCPCLLPAPAWGRRHCFSHASRCFCLSKDMPARPKSPSWFFSCVAL